MQYKNDLYRRFQPSRLRFPQHLVFRSSGDGNLVCNRKKVKIIASQMVRPVDYPPTNIEIDAVGLFLFTPSDVDVYIFSFLNQTKKETECAIVPAGVFSNYKPHQEEDGEIKLKLFLSSFGLVEFRDNDGGEFYFMGIFDKSRSYTKYYMNWSFFE